jgi:exonuclease III
MDLHILTLNANGLRNDASRQKLFFWLQKHKVDIAFLQETHSQDDVMFKWNKEWEGTSYWAHGTNTARGVAILIRKHLNANITDVHRDTTGRTLTCNISLDDFKLKLINVYAPNIGQERRSYFKQLHTHLANVGTDVVIGGDFNCALNSSIDRVNCSSNTDVGNVELHELMGTYHVEDIWRRRYPAKKEYTYHHGDKASRIDYFLISKSLDSQVRSIKIIHCPYSDHDATIIAAKLQNCERGPGTWKMNNRVIKSDTFKTSFKALWTGCKQSMCTYQTKTIWWDVMKIKIKHLCMEISKAQNVSKFKVNQWEETLQTLKNSPDQDKDHNINALKKRIDKWYADQSDAARLRSKTQWYEEGEKSTSYFFNLERSNGK